jgi:beta-mannosidase
MKTLSLNGTDWDLRCYWQHQWRLKRSADQSLKPALPVMKAEVPGAIHQDLLRAGLIEDWQVGLNASRCEWINNRDWGLSRQLHVPEDFDGQLLLECDGLDYSGYLLLDGQEVATFEGTHFRHQFDLTGRILPGRDYHIEFIFDIAPQIDGVFGYTSRIRKYKPRFGYCWDWCTRIVNVGIWQDVRLVSRGPSRFQKCFVNPRVDADMKTGHVQLAGELMGAPARLRAELKTPDGQIQTTQTWDLAASTFADLSLSVDELQLWWPAGMGDQPLYELTLELLDDADRVSDRITRTVGFKQVRWLVNPGGPQGARPYRIEINGITTFLRGVNWVPLSPLYGTVSPQQYRSFIELYRNMNVNILRVWGGGILEKPGFYEACDELGLMVWQEFPLSSSGIDNWPPEDPEIMDHLEQVAAEFVERRCHHASHVLWCGGNELQGAIDGSKMGVGKPVDESHPLMQRWQKLTQQLDPGKRFQTSSPTGPRFCADANEFGTGVNHQTHGPWGVLPRPYFYEYFNRDDSLFRSETGVSGCSSLEALERYQGDQTLWPPDDTNPHWLTPAAHWIPFEAVTREFGDIEDSQQELPFVVRASQYLQADEYRYIAESTRRRYPTCSGFLIWMGHDSVHCTANNSVIQVDATVKPAYDWLQRAYSQRHVSLRHDQLTYAAGEKLHAEVWCHQDEHVTHADGQVRAELISIDGQVIATEQVDICQLDALSQRVLSLDWSLPEFKERLFVVSLEWKTAGEVVRNQYLLSQQETHSLAPVRSLPPASLEIVHVDESLVRLRNAGDVAAIGVRLVSQEPSQLLLTQGNNVILPPGREAEISYQLELCTWRQPRSDDHHLQPLAVVCLNASKVYPVNQR